MVPLNKLLCLIFEDGKALKLPPCGGRRGDGSPRTGSRAASRLPESSLTSGTLPLLLLCDPHWDSAGGNG